LRLKKKLKKEGPPGTFRALRARPRKRKTGGGKETWSGMQREAATSLGEEKGQKGLEKKENNVRSHHRLEKHGQKLEQTRKEPGTKTAKKSSCTDKRKRKKKLSEEGDRGPPKRGQDLVGETIQGERMTLWSRLIKHNRGEGEGREEGNEWGGGLPSVTGLAEQGNGWKDYLAKKPKTGK